MGQYTESDKWGQYQFKMTALRANMPVSITVPADDVVRYDDEFRHNRSNVRLYDLEVVKLRNPAFDKKLLMLLVIFHFDIAAGGAKS